MPLFHIFADIILPVVLVIACGYVLQRVFNLDIKSFSRVTFYVLSPCLAFSSLLKSTLGGAGAVRIWIFVLALALILWFIATILAGLLKLGRQEKSAFLLSSIFMNTGNYGLPVLLFAFGQVGLQMGVIYFIGSAVILNTLGIFLAARGRAGIRASLRRVFSVPMVYAVVLALLFNLAGIELPKVVLRSTQLLGDATVPIMELLLGMQLARTSLQREWCLTLLASFVRLVVAAGVAFVLAGLLGLQGVARQACIVQASTPTAITTTILATEFDDRPEFVTSIVFLTTLASVVTMTVLLGILM